MIEYADWLENMLTMSSKNYLDLVHASDEKVLQSIPLPASNAIRKAIRLISQNARQIKGNLEDKHIEKFTQVLIEHQQSKLHNQTEHNHISGKGIYEEENNGNFYI